MGSFSLLAQADRAFRSCWIDTSTAPKTPEGRSHEERVTDNEAFKDCEPERGLGGQEGRGGEKKGGGCARSLLSGTGKQRAGRAEDTDERGVVSHGICHQWRISRCPKGRGCGGEMFGMTTDVPIAEGTGASTRDLRPIAPTGKAGLAPERRLLGQFGIKWAPCTNTNSLLLKSSVIL